MIQSALILFFSALLGGFIAIKSIDSISKRFKYLLVFAGSFLFSVTVLHLVPELFESEVDHFYVALGILGGFFFQQYLEYFTNGVEHGHMHVHHKSEGHTAFSGMSLMIALCIHSFLEGTLLAHSGTIHVSHTEDNLLAGIVLHKIPEVFALMSVLCCHYKSLKTQLILLLIFSLGTPLGIFTGHFITQSGLLGSNGMVLLFAFVAGNFLHISTTIFIESSPEHRWNGKKMIISGAAAGIAVLAELIL